MKVKGIRLSLWYRANVGNPIFGSIFLIWNKNIFTKLTWRCATVYIIVNKPTMSWVLTVINLSPFTAQVEIRYRHMYYPFWALISIQDQIRCKFQATHYFHPYTVPVDMEYNNHVSILVQIKQKYRLCKESHSYYVLCWQKCYQCRDVISKSSITNAQETKAWYCGASEKETRVCIA